jgi:cytochrome c
MSARHALRRVLVAAAAVLALVAAAASSVAGRTQTPRVLVFTKTAGFRHASIEAGAAAVAKLGRENGFAVDATADAGAFTDANLRRYGAVVFLSTTGDVLDARQQDALERYVQAGGGWVGVHAAADTEYDWPWYHRLVGAYFLSHPNDPNVRRATFRVRDTTHLATRGLPARWEREDEFYNFRDVRPGLRVLVDIDETTYQGGTNGANHPMAWYHEVDGGRAFYTALGHTEASFAEAPFLRHLLGGIRWAMGTGALDYAKARPEENRFTKVVLAAALEEPVELAVLPGERVLFIERRGAVKLYSPASRRVATVATIPVSLKYTNGDQAEDGLLGLAADPDFAANGWVYLYYSPAGPEPKNVLARYTMKGDALDPASRRVLLEVPVQRDQCCHTGGSIAFDGRGNLYLSTGDNTNPFATGYAPTDERPGRGPWDAQKSSANTNDLRGKILRIHPEPDGTYTVPEGNLFPRGTPKTRPEIYTMGHRNPYRIAVDRRTGFLYWGDVGPDAPRDSAERGPAGHDEINQARRAGNFGWPYFVGDNKRYYDIDFATRRVKGLFDPARPVNDSPNNTGLAELPPAEKAFIWYPAGPSAEFPLVGTGGRTAMAGPVYRRDDFRGAARAFPAYYDGKLLTYEWMRGWVMAVALDPNGDLRSMERFMPSHKFSNPIDMAFAPSGDLYMLEYGTRWFQGNDDARLVRIEYNAGNRAPTVAAAVDRPAGALPLRVALSSAGTADPDDDALRYEWTVSRRGGGPVVRLAGAAPSLTLERPGVYTAALAVTDAHGARGTAQVQIAAGNEPPRVDIDLVGGNRTFFFPGAPVRYAVRVADREDGSLADGRIAPARVTVTATAARDAAAAAAMAAAAAPAPGHQAPPPAANDAGRRLIEGSTCLSCHQINAKSVGPAYTAVARKYRGDAGAAARLVAKIRGGGSGVWGPAMMPPHPQLTEAQASRMVAYILGLGAPRAAAPAAAPSLPVRGAFTPAAPRDSAGRGVVVLRAAYADRGANGPPERRRRAHRGAAPGDRGRGERRGERRRAEVQRAAGAGRGHDAHQVRRVRRLQADRPHRHRRRDVRGDGARAGRERRRRHDRGAGGRARRRAPRPDGGAPADAHDGRGRLAPGAAQGDRRRARSLLRLPQPRRAAGADAHGRDDGDVRARGRRVGRRYPAAVAPARGTLLPAGAPGGPSPRARRPTAVGILRRAPPARARRPAPNGSRLTDPD